jgi:ABC-type histidine transport system ATPase subunit
MADGYIQEAGTPDEIFNHAQNERLQSFLHSILR